MFTNIKYIKWPPLRLFVIVCNYFIILYLIWIIIVRVKIDIVRTDNTHDNER